MESGEAIVYQGTDFATDFEMIGSFKIGKPVSIRGSTQLGSDRVVITEDGYINISTALSKARLNDAGNFGEKIVREVKKEVAANRDKYGWEVKFLPSQALLIINVPKIADSRYRQHVMNTNTGAWSYFDEWKSITYCEHDNKVYFGTPDDEIREAFTGTSDNGENIEIKWVPAFNNFEMPTIQKQATFCTVVTDFYAPSYIQAHGQSNFNLVASPDLRNPIDNEGSLWDVSDWDDFVWAASGTVENTGVKAYSIPIGALGYAITVKIRLTNFSQSPKFYSLKLKYKQARTI
jgi:hypothetical protein